MTTITTTTKAIRQAPRGLRLITFRYCLAFTYGNRRDEIALLLSDN